MTKIKNKILIIFSLIALEMQLINCQEIFTPIQYFQDDTNKSVNDKENKLVNFFIIIVCVRKFAKDIILAI